MTSTLISILLGVAIPLGVNAATFFLTRRQVLADPSKWMTANVKAFMLRLILYGIVITAAALSLEVRFGAFIFSFTAVFVLLLVGEGMYFKRLYLNRNSR